MVKAQAQCAHTFTTAEVDAGKTPDRTNPQRVVLVVVVLIAIVEILVPRVVRVVLTRTPVIVASKPANHTPHREVLTTPRYLDAALINTKHQQLFLIRAVACLSSLYRFSPTPIAHFPQP
jgi:hypothetical protein